MSATQQLHDLGQSLWLDNITRDMLDKGTLKTIHRRAFDNRPYFESHDLRSRHQQEQLVRRRDQSPDQQRHVGRRSVFRAGHRGPEPRCRPVQADV